MNQADATAVQDDTLRTIADYLQERFPILGPIDATTPLLHTGAIDSLGFLEVITFLTEKFGITLDDDDFERSNLETPGALADFVRRKL